MCQIILGHPIYKFLVYIGKTNEKETNKFALGRRVVVDLTKHLKGKYHKVYFDNLSCE